MSLSISGSEFGDIISAANRTAVVESVQIIPTGANTELLAANANIKSLTIQNTSAYPLALSASGQTLSDIAPSGSNLCFVLYPGAIYPPPGAPLPTGQINAYQASGSDMAVYVATS
jgi:hypothetical protein